MYNIGLVEDEKNLNSILKTYLEKEGYNVSAFTEGTSALKNIHNQFHLWVLDIMLPDIDGFELIKEIKALNPDIPVIFISARNKDLDKIIGLEMGSDDYLAKPFLPRELIIRVNKLIERSYGKKEKDTSIIINGYTFDIGKRTISKDNQNIELTSKEYEIIIYMLENLGSALSREQLLDSVWGMDYFGSDRVVDDTIRRVRKKLPDLSIETIYGYGYRMVKS
ncbi:MAG: response regulator transcription factor [Firmicutes bacterium]|jgi:two-component system response regulator CssR|nr:response regulator transcription factor [Bacillota bacterium]